jgi:hypothetical protein
VVHLGTGTDVLQAQVQCSLELRGLRWSHATAIPHQMDTQLASPASRSGGPAPEVATGLTAGTPPDPASTAEPSGPWSGHVVEPEDLRPDALQAPLRRRGRGRRFRPSAAARAARGHRPWLARCGAARSRTRCPAGVRSSGNDRSPGAAATATGPPAGSGTPRGAGTSVGRSARRPPARRPCPAGRGRHVGRQVPRRVTDVAHDRDAGCRTVTSRRDEAGTAWWSLWSPSP